MTGPLRDKEVRIAANKRGTAGDGGVEEGVMIFKNILYI
jgi:hypothetical protein